jgi:hypothetical protein
MKTLITTTPDSQEDCVAEATLEAISLEESRRLIDLEKKIKTGLDTFVEVGEALLEIRDSRLYRIEHNTFEEYCREKWGMNPRYANRIIGASMVSENLGPMGPKPTTERQARPLTKLPPEEQPKAWAAAVEKAEGKQPTAKQVEEVVVEMMPAREESPQKAARKPRAGLSHKVVFSINSGEIVSIERCPVSCEQTLTLHVHNENALDWSLDKIRKKSFAGIICRAVRDFERKEAAK